MGYMNVESTYEVRKLHCRGPFTVEVPGSKSITNRALLLAAMGNRKCTLDGVLFSDDSRALLSCLEALGFEMTVDESAKRVTIQGTGGVIPKRREERNVVLDVRSAGTAARFLTVFLAFAGGDFEMHASPQMERRPMEPLLSILAEAGVEFTFGREPGHFPFAMHSDAVCLSQVTVDTTVSSQFTSALLMAGALLPDGLTVTVTGSRPAGSYIRMTLVMMEQFGIAPQTNGNCYKVPAGTDFGLEYYRIEPDLSGAAYFYSLAPLLGCDVCVKGVHRPSLQGDMRYAELLCELGCRLEDRQEGLWLLGDGISNYPGITVDMKDFSDQTMTLAVLASYADTPTEILNVGHIRQQESDRLSAVQTELRRMGVGCEEIQSGTGLRIIPARHQAARIGTYEDHRMAMSFALAGLRTEGIVIENPGCCAKTFENYFEVMDSLYRKPRVRALLFDVDDTLMDFHRCSVEAVKEGFEEIGLPPDMDRIERYTRFNEGLWRRLERGEMDRRTLLSTRWKLFFEQEGVDLQHMSGKASEAVDAGAFEEIYRRHLGSQHYLIEGADKLLAALSKKYRLYIVTNGVQATQKSRIAGAGIEKYFTDCFVSEEIGSEKPSKAFFEKVKNRLSPLLPQECMVIGDRLGADILGGVRAGMQTCWYNADGKRNEDRIHCDYIVKNYQELMEVLG